MKFQMGKVKTDSATAKYYLFKKFYLNDYRTLESHQQTQMLEPTCTA